MDNNAKNCKDRISLNKEQNEVKVYKSLESSWKAYNFFNVYAEDDTTLEMFEDLQLTRRI